MLIVDLSLEKAGKYINSDLRIFNNFQLEPFRFYWKCGQTTYRDTNSLVRVCFTTNVNRFLGQTVIGMNLISLWSIKDITRILYNRLRGSFKEISNI